MSNEKPKVGAMKTGENINLVSPALRTEVITLIEEIEKILDDPETFKAGEKLHRELSSLSIDDLLKPFTI